MAIKNSGSAKHEPPPLPHARLALSVIACAVGDIKAADVPRQRSAARFLNGSREFYFWAHVLEQESRVDQVKGPTFGLTKRQVIGAALPKLDEPGFVGRLRLALGR